MKNWLKKLFSKAFIISVLNLSLATSTTEVAMFAWNCVMRNKALIAGTALLAIGGVLNQADAETRINPDQYSEANPYIITPGQTLLIETGKPLRVTIANPNNIDQIVDPNGNWRSPNWWTTWNWLIMDATHTKRLIDRPWTWNIGLNDGNHATSIHNQADIIDRTAGSVSENQRPEVIRVDEGQSTKLSAGTHMKNHRWTDLSTNTIISQWTTDSIKPFWRGKIELMTADWTWVVAWITRDTMYIEIEPSLNVTKKEIAYPLTINWATYQLYEQDDQAGTISFGSYPGKKRTLINSFVGDGLSKVLSLPEDGTYLPAAVRRNGLSPVPATELILNSTGVITPTKETSSFLQLGNSITWSLAVPYSVYSTSGKLLQTHTSSHLTLTVKGIYIIKYTENGTQFSTKIMIK